MPRRPNAPEQPTIEPVSPFEQLAAAERADSRLLPRTLVVAGLAHLVLLALQLPSRPVVAIEPPSIRPVTVLRTTRFVEPETPVEPVSLPERRARQRPMPGPTPEAAEPVREWTPPEPPGLELPAVDRVWDIPDAPPPNDTGPMKVAGDVVAPVKRYAPTPVYPEPARRVRKEGVAIVEAILAVDGSVTQVRVLRDPGFGLGEAAAEAIQEWRFEPATLHGRPVAVYYSLTVNFSLDP